MKVIKKITVFLILLLIIIPLLSSNAYVKAASSNSYSDWDYVQEGWSLLGRDVNYKTFIPTSVSTSKYSEVTKNAKPFLEYRRTILKAMSIDGILYAAVLIDFYMNPNNYGSLSNPKCRSKYLTVTTSMSTGRVIDCAPLNQPSSKTVTVSGGGGLTLGGQADNNKNKNINGNISGSFTIGETKNVYELSFQPQRLLASDNVVRGFKVKYSYYKPNENKRDYLNYTSALRYIAIYKLDTPLYQTYNLSIQLDVCFFYDRAILSNIYVYGTIQVPVSFNLAGSVKM